MRVYTASRSTFPSYGVEFCFSAVGPGQVFKVWDSDRASRNTVSGLVEKREEGRRGERRKEMIRQQILKMTSELCIDEK